MCNTLGRPDAALAHGERALAIIRANGDEPIDEAFLCLALAGAHRRAGRARAERERLTEALALAARFEDASIRDWFEVERAKLEHVQPLALASLPA